METSGVNAVRLMDLHPKGQYVFVDSFYKVTPELLDRGQEIVVVVNGVDRTTEEFARNLSTKEREISVTEVKVDPKLGKMAFLVSIKRK